MNRKAIEAQKFSDARRQVERILDERLAEVKTTIMGIVDRSLDEKILNSREAVLAALEKVPAEPPRV